MKKVTLCILLVLFVAASYMIVSCATAGEPARPEEPAAAAAPPAPKPETAAAKPAEPAPAAPPAPVAAAVPSGVWEATGITATRNGRAVDLPRELTGYSMRIRLMESSTAEFVQGVTGYTLRCAYESAGNNLKVRVLDYRAGDRLLQSFSAAGIREFPGLWSVTVVSDTEAVLETEAAGLRIRSIWKKAS